MKVVYVVAKEIGEEDVKEFRRMFEKYGGVLRFLPETERENWFLKMVEGLLEASRIEDKLMEKIGEEFVEELLEE